MTGVNKKMPWTGTLFTFYKEEYTHVLTEFQFSALNGIPSIYINKTP